MIGQTLSYEELRRRLEQAFQAGVQRGVYEVVELNVTYSLDSRKVPLECDIAIRKIMEQVNGR